MRYCWEFASIYPTQFSLSMQAEWLLVFHPISFRFMLFYPLFCGKHGRKRCEWQNHENKTSSSVSRSRKQREWMIGSRILTQNGEYTFRLSWNSCKFMQIFMLQSIGHLCITSVFHYVHNQVDKILHFYDNHNLFQGHKSYLSYHIFW